MGYSYFVSYIYQKKGGSAVSDMVIVTSKPLSSAECIEEVRNAIRAHCGYKDVAICGIFPLGGKGGRR